MEKIIVIGCPGSGKSTLALQLKEKLGLPVVHLDQLWHSPGWKHITREAFDAQLDMALNMDRWIIDGDYNRTMAQRLAKCDTVIYLDFSRWQCLLGVLRRMLSHRGKVRPDMAEGCEERIDVDFLKYVWNYNRNNRVRNNTYLAQAKHAKRIVLNNRKEVREFLETL